jgi:hypothetical protein
VSAFRQWFWKVAKACALLNRPSNQPCDVIRAPYFSDSNTLDFNFFDFLPAARFYFSFVHVFGLRGGSAGAAFEVLGVELWLSIPT